MKVHSYQLIIFLITSAFLVLISVRSLRHINSHGFYRFFAWEFLTAQIVISLQTWFDDPLSTWQIISWTLLALSIYVAVRGFFVLHRYGESQKNLSNINYNFENTTKLITDKIYKYIRHPPYTSLLLLVWGAFLKNITVYGLVVSLFCTLFLYTTAKIEEKENVLIFGEFYIQYMIRSKMFIPFIF